MGVYFIHRDDTSSQYNKAPLEGLFYVPIKYEVFQREAPVLARSAEKASPLAATPKSVFERQRQIAYCAHKLDSLLSMHTEPLTRERPQGNILLLDQGKEVIMESSEVLKRFGVDGIIRIRDTEYGGINRALGQLGHFNLETAGHVIGSRYALSRIVRQGHYDVSSGVEVLPLLSFEQIYTAVCVRCEECIGYDELTPEYFQYSLGDVRDVPTLKAVTLDRYGRSLWGVSNDELLARGVAYTLLRFG